MVPLGAGYTFCVSLVSLLTSLGIWCCKLSNVNPSPYSSIYVERHILLNDLTWLFFNRCWQKGHLAKTQVFLNRCCFCLLKNILNISTHLSPSSHPWQSGRDKLMFFLYVAKSLWLFCKCCLLLLHVHTQYTILRLQDLGQTTALYVENKLPSSWKTFWNFVLYNHHHHI